MISTMRWLLAVLSAFLLIVSLTRPAPANPNQYAINVDGSGTAVGGFDPVAYFTAQGATRGRPEHAYQWKGARWLFVDAANRALFIADPERYAPRVGGFCATAAASGAMVDVDPRMWLIVKGRLYLYANAGVRDLAREDAEAQAAAAEAAWAARKTDR